MKEKLIELLGLKADASDDAVVAAVQSLQREAAAESDAKKQDAAIRALVNESHGALSYAAAKHWSWPPAPSTRTSRRPPPRKNNQRQFAGGLAACTGTTTTKK